MALGSRKDKTTLPAAYRIFSIKVTRAFETIIIAAAIVLANVFV